MKVFFATSALYGAAVVVAASLPRKIGLDGTPAALVDLGPFEDGKFTAISFKEAKKKFGVPSPDISALNTTDMLTMHSSLATAASGGCIAPKIRREWRNLPDSGKDAYIAAIKCLMNRPSGGKRFAPSANRYEDLVWLHQRMTPNIHMVGQFLPWHRYFLSVYQSLLHDECGYKGTIPWWDETKDAGRFQQASVFSPRWFGRAAAKTANGMGTCLSDGAFAGRTLHIGPGSDNMAHCISRAVDESLSAQVTFAFVRYCNLQNDYASMEPCTETGPHAFGHLGIGAVESVVAGSPGDPIFFMHHAFIDHNWRIWQIENPKQRLYQLGGFTTTTDPKRPLTRDYVLTSYGIRPDVTVAQVLNTVGGHLCYRYDY